MMRSHRGAALALALVLSDSLVCVLMLLGGTLPARAETPRAVAAAKPRRPRSPLHPPEHIVLGVRPVAIRLPIPPAILEEIRTKPPDGHQASYYIHFHNIEVPAHQATRIRGYARRWVHLLSLSHVDERYIGVVGTLARTVPQRFDCPMLVTRDDLRRFIGQKSYLVMTLVQIDSSGSFPARGPTVHIERIHLAADTIGEGAEGATTARPQALPDAPPVAKDAADTSAAPDAGGASDAGIPPQ